MKKFTKFGFRHLMSCLLILFAFGMHAQGQQQWPAVIMGPEKACPNDSLHYMLYVDLNLGCIEEYDTEWSVDGLEGGYRVGSGGGESSAYIDLVWLVSGDYTVTCKGTIYASTESIPFDVSFDVTVQETGVLTLADESGALEQSVCADAEIEPIIFDATNASPDYLVTDGDFSGLTIEWINNDTQLSITGTPEYPLTFTVATGNENCPNGPAQTITIDIIKYNITASVEGAGGTITSITPATVDCGGTSTIIFAPADCQEIKTVKDNNEDVTALVTNNTYVINDIQEDHNVIVTFDTIEYTITATVVGEGGTINPIGEVVVNCGNDKMFTFTPDECYQIKEILVDEEPITIANSYTFEDVAANHTISVEFELVPYTITATVVGGVGGTATVDPATVDCGGTSTVTFAPDDCNEIKNVTDNGEDVTALVENNKYVIDTVKANHAVVVTFGLIEYTITATVVGEGGTIDPSGEVVVNCGKDTTFTMTPDECYQISQVLVDGEDVIEEVEIDDDGIGSYTFRGVTANHTISVEFELIPYEIIGSVKNNEGGSITPMDTIADCGSNILFTMTPDACYRIKKVWDVYEEKDISNDITALATGVGYYLLENITADHKIEVTFAEIEYEVTVESNTGGTVTPNEDVTITCSGEQIFEVTPDACYEIESVTATNGTITDMEDGTYKLTGVTAATTVTVTFAEIEYEVTVESNTGGTVTPNEDVTITCSGEQIFEVTPDACYEIESVTATNGTITDMEDGTYKLTGVTAATTVTVTFAEVEYEVTVESNTGGTVTPNEDVTITCSGEQIFEVTPDACYEIESVTATNGTITDMEDGTYKLTGVTAATTVTVTFAEIEYEVTVESNTGGTVTPNEDVTITCSGEQIFEVTPDACYEIESVTATNGTITDMEDGTYKLTGVTAATTVTVTFAEIEYEVTVESNTGGTVTPNEDVTITCSGEQIFEVTPDACYEIESVTATNGTITDMEDGTYKLTGVTAATTVTVTFAEIEYEVTVESNTGGTVTPNEDVTITCSGEQIFEVTPDACYEIESVTATNGTITDMEDGTYKLTGVTAATTVTVTFAEIEYEVTVESNTGGTVTPNEDVTITCSGEQIFEVTPDACYEIESVTATNGTITDMEDGTYKLTGVTAATTVTVTFAEIEYEVTVESNTGGTVTPNEDVTITCSGEQIFEVTPEDCYEIVSVIATNGTITDMEDGTYKLDHVTAATTVTVTFAPIQYTITATTDGNGTIDPDGAVLVNCGDSIEFCFEATHNYEIEKVTVNGVDISGYAGDTLGCYTFTDVIADGTIHVTFKEIKPEPVLYGCPSDDLGMEGVGNGWINVDKSIPLWVEAKGNIEIHSVLWHSTNPNTAVVNPVSGLTTTASAVGPGATNVIATVQTNRGEFTLICYFEVIQPVKGIVVTPTQVSMYQYSTRQLVASVLPENASIKTVVWESSDETIATVNQQGLVTAVGLGSATITVTNIGTMYSDEIFTASCAVTVTKTLPTGVTMTPRTLTIDKGETFQLTATVAPVGANDNFTWTSSNANIVSVDATGVITANAAGSATITVRTVNNFYATCNVKVVVPVESITITAQGSTTLPFSGSVRLSATVLPADATDKSVKWISSNTAVATVSTTGVVTAKRVNGTVTITARNEASGVEGTIEIIVGTGGTPAPPAPAPIASEEGENITLFPNPTNGELTIRNEEAKMNSVRLFDLSGRMVIEKNNVNSNEASIDMTGLVEGVYFINVDGKTMKVVKK